VLLEILNGIEDHFEPFGTLPTKIFSYVKYEGNRIFKSSLVCQLNGNPFLSNDRLIIINNSIYFNNSEAYIPQCYFFVFYYVLGLGSNANVYIL